MTGVARPRSQFTSRAPSARSHAGQLSARLESTCTAQSRGMTPPRGRPARRRGCRRLFRKARPAHSSGPIGVIAGSPDRRSAGLRSAGYPVAIARLGCQSLRRLWVAVISRHSALQAHRPLRWNLSIRRLYLVCANTGSMIAWRCRYNSLPSSVATVRASRGNAFVVGESARVSSGSRRQD